MGPIRNPLGGRPILSAALAVALGSGLGASGSIGSRIALLVVLLFPGIAIAVPRRLRGILLHAFLAAAAALRAGTVVGGEEESGRWRPSTSSRDWTFGDLGAGTPRIALQKDSADPGDALLVLEREPPRTYARGPAPGRAARAGLAHPPVELPQGEVVRTASSSAEPARAPSKLASDARRRLLDRVLELEEPLTRGLVGGLLLGDLSEIPSGVGDLFVRTGTFHVLAISGLQVVLVAVLIAGPLASTLAWILRLVSLGRLRPGREGLRAGLLLAFVPVAGAGAPVMRSAIAWIAGSLASRLPVREPFETGASERFMQRTGDPLGLLGFALLVECLLHPDAPLSTSVQLTYLATFGLVAGTRPALRRIRDLLPGQGRIAGTGATGRPRPEWLRVPAQRLLDAGLGAVAASLAAVLATLPIVWTRFGEWCPAGVLATPAIALPVSWILVAGWSFLAAPGLVPEAALDVAARATIAVLEAFDGLPGSPADLPPRPLALLVPACGGLLLALRGTRPLVRRATALLWVAILVPWTAAPRGLEIHALDVGGGTAVALRAPGGGALVFDAGSRDRPGVDREALGPLLSAWEARRILVVLSHPDLDHDGALDWLVERHPPDPWAGALPAHLAGRLPRTTVRTDVGAGRILLAWPGPAPAELSLELSRALDVEGNEGSRTLEILWKKERLLLFGDAEAEGLSAWLGARHETKAARLVLFPHHGSDTEHLGELLATLRPEEIWVSTTGDPDVRRELARRRIPTRVTSRDGPLSMELP